MMAAGVATAQTQEQEPKRPNVILLVADDLGYGDLECYGATNVETPHVNALANSGIRFTDAHATAATSTPSRYSLLTGEYAWRRAGTGVAQGNAGSIINKNRYTMADMFHDAGYATGAFGKWHLGLGSVTGQQDWNGKIDVTPRDLGFDYHYIQAATADRVPCVYLEQDTVANYDPTAPIQVSYASNFPGEPTGVSHRDSLVLDWTHSHNNSIVDGISRIGYMKGGGKALWKDENIADSIAAHSARFIAEHKDEPFFMYLCTNDVHVPRWPHERFRNPDGTAKNIMGLRGAAIESFDWTVGEVMKALEENGVADNTLIILTSDNGPMLDDGYADQAIELLNGHRASGPYRGYKYSMFEGGTRVPFIVSWPNGVEAATEPNNTLVSHIDLFASLGKLVGMEELPEGAAPDSGDQLDQLLGKSKEHRPWIAEQNTSNNVSVRTAQWKYIPASGGGVRVSWIGYQDIQYVELGNDANNNQLYDMINDPGETTNVAAEHPEIIKELKALLDECKNGPAKPVNLPKASNEEMSYWYHITTPLRNNLYFTQAGSILKGNATANKERSQWQFVELADGTYYIINRYSDQYIDPTSAANQEELKASTVAPAVGYKIDWAETDNYVVIYTEDCTSQINMNNSSRLINWGGGRHGDNGCQFLLTLVDSTAVEQIELPTGATTPQASQAESPVWYSICAPARDGVYLSINGEGALHSRQAKGYSDELAWRLERRADGSHNIVNQNGKYIIPETVSADDKHFQLADAAGNAGWEIKPLNKDMLFTIVSGSKQICVNEELEVINYGGGMNTGNDGVKFRFTDLSPILAEQTGISTIAAGEQGEVWYDTYGRRVNNPRRGVFISNQGRKILF